MTEPVWTDEHVAVFIGIEKRLCAILGKQWQPSGMSTDTLLEEVRQEVEKLREALESAQIYIDRIPTQNMLAFDVISETIKNALKASSEETG